MDEKQRVSIIVYQSQIERIYRGKQKLIYKPEFQEMDSTTQPASDDLHHFISFLPVHHVDPASANNCHNPIIYRTSFDLGGQLRFENCTQPDNPISAALSNQLRGAQNERTIS